MSDNFVVPDLDHIKCVGPDPSLTYEPIEFFYHAENLELYSKGGWCPVNIGTMLRNDRYEIVHKLGTGGSSTIWLARDHIAERYVAIKIAMADLDSTAHEESIHRRIFAASQKALHHGLALIPEPMDSFTHSSPNGSHRCIVSELLMGSLFDLQEDSNDGMFEDHAARSVVAQVILAVKAMHAAGIGHGDLHPGNVLFRQQIPIHSFTKQQLYNTFHAPTLLPLKRQDGQPLTNEAPSDVILTLSWSNKCEDMAKEHCRVVLGDFGESWDVSETRKEALNTPDPWRAPESWMAPQDISLASDIWSLACLTFDILTGCPLFSCTGGPTVLAEHVAALGKLPDTWWQQWQERGVFFNDYGTILPPEGNMYRPLPLSLRERVEQFLITERPTGTPMAGDEAEALVEMLTKMLAFNVSERASIDDVVACRWMQEWGLPELESLRRSEVKFNNEVTVSSHDARDHEEISYLETFLAWMLNTTFWWL